MKDYNNLKNSDCKREKIFKLKSSLYLMMGFSRGGGKLILFFVDRVNVSVFWESSLQNMDGVARLLSSEISKRLEAKTYTQQVVRRGGPFISIPQLKILTKILIKKGIPLSIEN